MSWLDDKNIDELLIVVSDLDEQHKVVRRDLTAARAELKRKVAREREVFGPDNFTFVSVVKSDRINYVAREGMFKGVKKVVNKLAIWWVIWDQHDNEGNFLRKWAAPAVKQLQRYPDFIRPHFKRYLVFSGDEVLPEVPEWLRPYNDDSTCYMERVEEFVKIRRADEPAPEVFPCPVCNPDGHGQRPGAVPVIGASWEMGSKTCYNCNGATIVNERS